MKGAAALLLLLLTGALCPRAQIVTMLDHDMYMSRVKLVSEFMKRFNGEKPSPGVDPSAPDFRIKNICQLFDIEQVLKDRRAMEPRVLQFADSVADNGVTLHFGDAGWYAKAKCAGTFKGKDTAFTLYLTVEPRGKDMYKWVIADAEGKIFDLAPSRKSEKIMLLPNENEAGFMNLHSITTGKDDYITLYSARNHPADPLTVFNTLVYYGYLDINYVSGLEFVFLQVPGYEFTIKEFDRNSSNAGWLISSFREMDAAEKRAVMQRLRGEDYPSVKPEANPGAAPKAQPEAPQRQTDAVSPADAAKVEGLVEALNDFIASGGGSARDVDSYVDGRYKFIITDEISRELASLFKAEKQDSYRMDSLLEWLGNRRSPVKSITVSGLKPFENDEIRPEYSNKGFTLIEGQLSTGGDLQITEQVVFFIYENQIAGVKTVSDVF